MPLEAPTLRVIDTVAATGGKSRRHAVHFFQKGRQRTLDHATLDALAARLAGRLLGAGLVRGDRLGLIARNGIEWVLIDLAAIKAGLVTAGFEFGKINPTSEQVRKYGLKAVFADVAVDAPEAIDLRPLVEAVLATADNAADDPNGPPAGPGAAWGDDDATTIKFTSGSTGEPKGLCARVGSIESSLSAVQQIFDHRDGDNLLVFLPLSLLQQRYWIYSALAFGHDVTVAAFEYVLDAAKTTQPTVVMGVPGFYEGLRRQVERADPEAARDPQRRRAQIDALLGPRVRYLWTGSAPASSDTLAFFDDAGVPLFEGYGMNETCIVSKNHPGAHRRGSVGRLMPNKRARIDDDGVLVIGADQPVNTAYTFCAPGDSERIFLPSGEVRTGDLARIDDEGYLYILGRADDVLVLANGKNVHTRALEERVKQHQGVGECVVFGSGKPYLVAVIAPAEGDAPCDAISAHIAQINAGLKPDERIVKTFFAPDRFSVESGLLTSQFKPRRKEIYKAFSREIDQLYGVTA